MAIMGYSYLRKKAKWGVFATAFRLIMVGNTTFNIFFHLIGISSCNNRSVGRNSFFLDFTKMQE